MIEKFLNIRKFIIILLLSLLFSIFFFNDQVAVRGGLVLSGEVIYNDNLSPLKYYFLNSWTLLTQISAILLKIGLTTKIVSFFLVLILNLLLFFTCFVIFEKFIKDYKLSIFLSCLLIFFQKNLGDTDYPSLIFTIHTFGAYAQALTGLIISSLLLKNLKLTYLLSFILFCVHPIVGLWILSILVFFTIYLKKIKNFKFFLTIFLPGLLITFLSLSFYFYLSIEKVPYDQNLFNIYLDRWDGHRAITGEIHYEYLIKSLLTFLIVFYLCPKNENNKFFINVFLSIIISSAGIYLLFKFFNLNNYEILAPIIPGRFMTTYAFVAWPIVLALIYFKFFKKKFINHFFYTLIILYSLMHYKTFINVKNNIFKKEDNLVFNELKSIKDTGNIIATADSAFNVLYLSKKPLLITRTIDYLPYHPYLVGSISKILEEIYGYDFKSPPIPNYPYLSDKFIKKKFENRTKEDWKKIQKNYNSNYLIAPKSWKINLEIAITDKKFNLYQIN